MIWQDELSACEGLWCWRLTWPFRPPPIRPYHRETLSYLKKKRLKNPYHQLETVPMALTVDTPRGNSTRVSNPWSLYQSLSLSLSLCDGIHSLLIAGLYQRFCFERWQVVCCVTCVYCVYGHWLPRAPDIHTRAHTAKGDRHGTLH
jgi:hypothetical protein